MHRKDRTSWDIRQPSTVSWIDALDVCMAGDGSVDVSRVAWRGNPTGITLDPPLYVNEGDRIRLDGDMMTVKIYPPQRFSFIDGKLTTIPQWVKSDEEVARRLAVSHEDYMREWHKRDTERFLFSVGI